MIRKNYLISFLTIALFLMGSVAVFAQNAPIRGKVELTKEDGTKVPVAGAMIEVYQLDSKTKFAPGKTDKKGIFAFVALPLGAQFVLSISAPSIKPEIQGGIKAGNENILIPVLEGDGKRWTEDEVRAALANPTGNQTTEESPEAKKKREEYEKQVAEINSKNQKALKSNEVVAMVLKEGGEAFKAKNYDVAIAKYEEGYTVDPTFLGSAPVMLNNKALVLINRGTDTFNASSKGDEAARTAARESAKKDFSEAVTASEKAIEMLKPATSTDAKIQKDYEANILFALTNRKVAYRAMAQTGADRTKGKEALIAFQEYIAAEPDPARKSKAQVDLALTLQDSNEFELAIVEFQKMLGTDPNNIDALVGVGLSLVNVGYINLEADPAKGKTQLQEAANYLQKFIDLAPADNKLLASVKESLADLKTTQNVAPQKIKSTPTTKKKN